MGQFSSIKTYENIFTEQDQLEIIKFLNSSSWCFGQYSHKQKETHKKFWFMDLMNCDFFCVYLMKKICELAEEKFSLIKVYANGQTYGQDGYWHLDSENSNEYTFLYYANLNWKVTWGGETVFNVDNSIISFIPKPNSGLLFPANIYHYAKSPSRDFYDLRTTIAFKLKKENL